MNSIARRYAGYNVPRYTSYPTAADFTSMIGASDHAAWLGHLGGQESVSVYLHVPYCREICLYCGCHTKMAHRIDVLDRYRRAVETEIEIVADLLNERPGIARLHWGGGTPSILGLNGLKAVFATLDRNFSFDDGFEHAIELDPRHVTAELANGLADLGISRASLGIQDVNPQVQAAIGRFQPLIVIEAAVERLRLAGISNLSFDLMYGLPLQTLEIDPQNVRIGGGVVAEPYRLFRLCASSAAKGEPAANQRNAASLPGPAHRSGRPHDRGTHSRRLCEDRNRSFRKTRRCPCRRGCLRKAAS